MIRTNWSREELILAFNLYLKLPFGKMHRSNPDVIHLSNIIGRTPSAVAMRLTNFASVDPYHKARGVSGLTGGAKQCQPIWDEFSNNKESLIFESERILAEKENVSLETKYADILGNLSNYKGEVKERLVKTRVNQNVFRQIILSTYTSKCAISGIDFSTLLVASHIIPWSINEKERMNPENGICLSNLYDRAFDKGLIGISTDYRLLISKKLKSKESASYFDRYFGIYSNKEIAIPERFKPKKEFLEYHLDTVFDKG
jgi:putative restriction endonuclease